MDEKSTTKKKRHIEGVAETSVAKKKVKKAKTKGGTNSAKKTPTKESKIARNDRIEQNFRRRNEIMDEAGECMLDELIEIMQMESPLSRLIIVKNAGEPLFSSIANSLRRAGIPWEHQTYESGEFGLEIGGILFARGKFPNLIKSREPLAQMALKKLKEICFIVEKKAINAETLDFVQMPENVNEKKDEQPSEKEVLDEIHATNPGYKMLLKMGWAGKGLGSNEQGITKAIKPATSLKLYTSNSYSEYIMENVDQILADFAASDSKILAFDESLSRDARAAIHKKATLCCLQSKTVALPTGRKLTLRKNLRTRTLIASLLRIGGEDELYKVNIPQKFAALFENFEDKRTMKAQEMENLNTNRSELDIISEPKTDASPNCSIETEKLNELFNVMEKQNPLSRLIILKHHAETHYDALIHSCKRSKVPWNHQKYTSGECGLQINGVLLAKVESSDLFTSREILAQLAFEKLKQTCFIIEKKEILLENLDVIKASESEIEEIKEYSEKQLLDKIHNTNPGYKMLLKLGWCGKGLGSNEQGITKAIQASSTKRFAKPNDYSENVMKNIDLIFGNYVASGSTRMLTFERDISKKNLALIDKKAKDYGLTIKTIPLKGSTKVIISRDLTEKELILELLKIGGENEYYKMNIPDKFAYLFENFEEDF